MEWGKGEIIVYFVKCDQIKLEAECVFIGMLVIQKWCPGFKILRSQVGTSQNQHSLAASWQSLLIWGPEFNEHE